MIKRWLWIGTVLLTLIALTGGQSAWAGPSQAEGILYESRPDEVALYLSDLAFVRDQVTLPPGQDVRVLLPPGTYPNTLMLTEGGQRVHRYRITPQSQADLSGWSAAGGAGYVLTWTPNEPVSGDQMREITLEYLVPGASWTPSYDMVVLDDSSVALAFFAEIRNAVFTLEEARVYLVAGRVDLSQQLDQVPMVTMNQYAVGYSDEMVTLPALGVGSVQLQHVYPLETVTALPGDIVYTSLVDATLSARSLNVWNAATDQETDVIYKVMNDTELPLAEGIMRVYQDGLFRGSDFIETTPVGSEGSVTVGSLPDVRVHRAASQTYQRSAADDYYQHTVTLEIQNYSPEACDLIVLDIWHEEARNFEYSLEPERDPNNTFRWEVSIPAGETLTITYQFETDY